MVRKASLYNALTKGVLDPALSERVDLKHHYQSLASGLNIECLPQGGVRRRAGHSQMSDSYYRNRGYKGRLRRRIQPVAVTSAMITATNGGTVASLIDQNAATTFDVGSVNGSVWVLFEVDLGTAQEITFIDVIDVVASAGRWNNAIAVEYWNGTSWVELEGAADIEASARKDLSTVTRTRRFGTWPGGDQGQKVNARSWRVVCYSGVGPGVITISGMRLWQEKRQISPTIIYSFERSTDLVYELVLTDRNIDVFREQRYQASISVDIDARQISEINHTQSLDTLLLYHEDVATQRITRQGANDEWDSRPVAYTNVPSLTAGSAFAGDQDEVQDIYLHGLNLGAQFVLWLGDKVTSPITYASSTLASDVEAALEAVGVNSGLEVSLNSSDGVFASLRLTFTGNSGGRRWPAAAAVMLASDTAEPETRILQRGLDASGPMMGETTGWPRCGRFYQERHMIGGMRGAPMTIGFSKYAGEFDFTDTASPQTADLAFFITLNTDALETIHNIFIGQHIQIFTDATEWYVETRVLDATQPVNILVGTRYGMKNSVPVVFANGSTLFMQRGGRVLRDMVFSDVELSYKSEPLSLLAPHLLTNVVDVGHRSARSTDEANQLFMINEAGDLAFLALLKEQEVVAMAPWETDGKYKSVIGDQLARVWIIVERESVKNGTDLYLEKLDGSHTLDGAIAYDHGGAPSDVVSGLDAHEDKDVWAWSDGDLVGPMRVTGGQVKLPKPAAKVTVGLFPPIRGQTPKLREKLENELPFRPPGRIYEIELALAGTGQIDISVNGGPFRDVVLPFGADEKALDIGLDRPRDTSGISEGSVDVDMERLIGAVSMIPGSGAFVYATSVVLARYTPPDALAGQIAFYENRHSAEDEADFKLALGQALEAMPKLRNMALFTSWFGSDLRCANNTIKPKVADKNAGAIWEWEPNDWAVAGLTRATADEVSQSSGKSAFGATPADWTIVEAIKEMTTNGVAVTFTPFLMMDVAAGNTLPNPYGGASQPVYPWRGRITCDPAPGVVGSPDLTAAAKTQVDAFVGVAAVGDFTIIGEDVTYSGPNEWSYRRMILHYAHLCKAAGGVDSFVIGSEMRGLGWVRDVLGSYPFVTALKTLAADVKAVLGPSTKITYAADWSEYFGHSTGIAGELFFHLDPLWSDSNIDAIGIDNYWPLADWRDGEAHLDFVAGNRSVYDFRYLQSNIAGGEGYDWYYASQADRDSQTRTDITDGAYNKPWVWRFKDIKSWWENSHYNRPAGVEDAAPTSWVAASKPIWFMEAGCPAVDKGANQPNVFYDPKSSESFFPYYSAGKRDDKMQRAYIEALLSYYSPGQSGYVDDNNPVSSSYNDRMVDPSRIYIYTWDARFYPAYPESDFWGDGSQYETGHWISGRLFLSSENAGDGLPVGLDAELPFRDRLITGNIRITNLRGWSRHPIIEFSQSMPAPLELRAIRYEVAHHG